MCVCVLTRVVEIITCNLVIWMAKAFLKSFHAVFVTYVFVFVCTCIVENKIFF